MGLKELQLNTITVATPSQLDRVRSPETIFTNGYLNDPIQYKPDDRFEPKTVVRQFPELPNQIRRDFAEFIQVNRNDDDPQLLTVNMFSHITRRNVYNQVIGPRAKFTQFGV